MNNKLVVLIIVILAIISSSCNQNTDSSTEMIVDVGNFANASEETVLVSASASSPPIEFDDIPVEDQVVALYKYASPSVVNITSVEYIYNRMLGNLPEEGIGSGFVFDDEGHIITNYHVVANADELLVTLASGEEFKASIVGVDAINDLAVLKIDVGSALPPALKLADSDTTQIGESVLAIGNPYGLDQTLTTGVVSALGRVIESPIDGFYIAEAIQTDAAINPGNSGGPLINMDGLVIGVNSQIISSSGSSAGAGFAISSNLVNMVASELIETGTYQHPWLGLQTMDLSAYSIAILQEAGIEITVASGVLVTGLEEGSPAASADINLGDKVLQYGPYRIPVGGDIIVAINDVPVETFQEITVYMETQTRIGDTIYLTIVRNGVEKVIPVTLSAQ